MTSLTSRFASLDAVLLIKTSGTGGNNQKISAILSGLLKKADIATSASLDSILTATPAEALNPTGPNFGTGRNYSRAVFFDHFGQPGRFTDLAYHGMDRPSGIWHTALPGPALTASATHDDEWGTNRCFYPSLGIANSSSPTKEWYSNNDTFALVTKADANDSSRNLSCLRIKAQARSYSTDAGTAAYTSGLVSTQFAFSPSPPCYIEAKLLTPSGTGLWPAFYLMNVDNGTHGMPIGERYNAYEIDIAHLSGNTNDFQGKGAPKSQHYCQEHVFATDGHGGGIRNTADGRFYPTSIANDGTDVPVYTIPDFTTGFNTIGIEWTADRLRYYVNRQLVGYSLDSSGDFAGQNMALVMALRLAQNNDVWFGGWHMNVGDDGASGPWYLYVDYIGIWTP